MNSEARKSVTIKMKPSVVRKARVAAVSLDRRLGDWLEEAIAEKVAREEREEKKDK